tara:strand:- start:1729 stop:2082 length:354 start_codon:yes stop_codon:yes gene_type:complete
MAVRYQQWDSSKSMLKQIVSLLLASVIVLAFLSYLSIGMGWLLSLENDLYGLFQHVFAGGAVGRFMSQMVVLLVIPLVCTAVPAGVYWAVNRKPMPYLNQCAWVFWLVLATILVFQK